LCFYLSQVAPLPLPSPPNQGERIKVRGFKAVPMPVPLFMRKSIEGAFSESKDDYFIKGIF